MLLVRTKLSPTVDTMVVVDDRVLVDDLAVAAVVAAAPLGDMYPSVMATLT